MKYQTNIKDIYLYIKDFTVLSMQVIKPRVPHFQNKCYVTELYPLPIEIFENKKMSLIGNWRRENWYISRPHVLVNSLNIASTSPIYVNDHRSSHQKAKHTFWNENYYQKWKGELDEYDGGQKYTFEAY